MRKYMGIMAVMLVMSGRLALAAIGGDMEGLTEITPQPVAPPVVISAAPAPGNVTGNYSYLTDSITVYSDQAKPESPPPPANNSSLPAAFSGAANSISDYITQLFGR